jgi:hypothetical protein
MSTSEWGHIKHKAAVIRFFGISLMTLLTLSACVMMKAYDGAVLPADEISVIRPDTDKAFTRVRILGINEYPVGRFRPGLMVTPGQNTIAVQVTLDYPYLHGFFYFCETLTFDTAPGESYTVYGKIAPLLETGYIWVETDSAPGRIVAESIKIPIRTETYPHCKAAG